MNVSSVSVARAGSLGASDGAVQIVANSLGIVSAECNHGMRSLPHRKKNDALATKGRLCCYAIVIPTPSRNRRLSIDGAFWCIDDESRLSSVLMMPSIAQIWDKSELKR